MTNMNKHETSLTTTENMNKQKNDKNKKHKNMKKQKHGKTQNNETMTT